MEKIVKFFECLAPVSICNLECEYCYLIQQNRRTMLDPEWDYNPGHIAKALSKKRLGGCAYISICGQGETLISNNVIELTQLLLSEGHFVNITTNGTLSMQFDKLLATSKENLLRLHIAFSFHYLELKRKNLIDTFFDNIKKVKDAGCSFVLQLNLYDGYIPYIDEIKRLSVEHVGAYPQIALTRKQKTENGRTKYYIHTDLPEKEYIQFARSFNSPLFECTLSNFNIKRKEFCYAGLWSGVIDLKTGNLRQCYFGNNQNICDDLSKPISFNPVGKHCKEEYCVNSSHFLSLGVIPDVVVPTYADLRNRNDAEWYNPTVKAALSTKLYLNNIQFSDAQKIKIWVEQLPREMIDFTKRLIPNFIKISLKKVLK